MRERSTGTHAARISVQATGDHRSRREERVRSRVDRVRTVGLRRLVTRHRVLRFDHDRTDNELVVHEMAPVPGAVLFLALPRNLRPLPPPKRTTIRPNNPYTHPT